MNERKSEAEDREGEMRYCDKTAGAQFVVDFAQRPSFTQGEFVIHETIIGGGRRRGKTTRARNKKERIFNVVSD